MSYTFELNNERKDANFVSGKVNDKSAVVEIFSAMAQGRDLAPYGKKADVAAKYSAGLILNHSRGTPETMNLPENLSYPSGLVEMVRDELTEAAEFAISRGVRRESIILDPGFGFSKDTQQNLELLGSPEKLLSLGYPLLSGPSRKRFIGELTGESDPAARDYGTCGAVIASALAGYAVIRVHNVKAAKDCLSVFYGCHKKAKNL